MLGIGLVETVRLADVFMIAVTSSLFNSHWYRACNANSRAVTWRAALARIGVQDISHNFSSWYVKIPTQK